MKKVGWIVLFLLIASCLVAQNNLNQFDRGIVYYLMNDMGLAKEYLESFFHNRSSYQLRNGYDLLVQGKYWEATKAFKDFLDINHRSQIGLVGIALSTVDMKNTASVENLQRTIRLNPRFASAYACLGVEYKKKRNFPRAEAYFKKALRYSPIPEFKILLADFYLLVDRPESALQLIQEEADRYPKNFYYNLLTAKCLYQLNRPDPIGSYINQALTLRPDSPDAKLLQAKFLISQREYSQAKSVMNGFRFETYNGEYVKTLGQLLLELKDRKALTYLYEFFSKNRWDRDINRLMGRYYLNRPEQSNVQNWIFRSILSGNNPEKLKQLFSDNHVFPEYPILPFFDVREIRWVSDSTLLVIATRKSGDPEKMFFIDTEEMKVTSTLNYQGRFQGLFMSKKSKNIIISTVAAANERVYLYALHHRADRYFLRAASARSIRMATVLVGFNIPGDQAFITDGSISSLAFESPFSTVSIYGDKKMVYPVYPFPVYRYDFASGRISQLKINNQPDRLERIPIRDIRKYTLVCRAFQTNTAVGDLIQRGRRFDLTSSQVIKIHFNRNLTAFIIYLADLKNPFQALVYDEFTNKMYRLDATMFLGQDRYAALKIHDFDPRERDILLVTSDKKRELIEFNYGSFLYRILAQAVDDVCVDPGEKMIVVLTERSDNIYYKDTNLELVSLKPFVRKRITARRDLYRIRECQTTRGISFITNHGERVVMDDGHHFQYLGVSLEGAVHNLSPDEKKAAVFINGQMFVLDWVRRPQ